MYTPYILLYVWLGYSDQKQEWPDLKSTFSIDWCQENLTEYRPDKQNVCIQTGKGDPQEIVLKVFDKWSRKDRMPKDPVWTLDLSQIGDSIYADKVYNRCTTKSICRTAKKSKKEQKEGAYAYLCKIVQCPKMPNIPNRLPIICPKIRDIKIDWTTDVSEMKETGKESDSGMYFLVYIFYVYCKYILDIYSIYLVYIYVCMQ